MEGDALVLADGRQADADDDGREADADDELDAVRRMLGRSMLV